MDTTSRVVEDTDVVWFCFRCIHPTKGFGSLKERFGIDRDERMPCRKRPLLDGSFFWEESIPLLKLCEICRCAHFAGKLCCRFHRREFQR